MRISVKVAIPIVASLFGTLMLLAASQTAANNTGSVAPALAGFDSKTNGFVSQAQFDADRDLFEEKEDLADGLGPVYNAPVHRTSGRIAYPGSSDSS